MTPKLKDLNEEIIPDLLDIRIPSTMSVPTLRALDAIYTLRSWLSSASHDINDAAYANLQVQRMLQISKALKTKYRRAKALTDKIEILSFIDTLEQDLTCKHSDFALEEATKLAKKHSSTLTIFQSLRLQLITLGSEFSSARGSEFSSARGSEFSELATASGSNLSQLATELLPEANTAFDLGTLTLIEHLLTPSLREALFNRITLLLETAIQQLTTSTTPTTSTTLPSLLTLFPYWNENPIYRQKLRSLTGKLEVELAKTTARSGSVEGQRPFPESSLSLPVLRLNPIAAEIYTKMDAVAGKYESRTIPA